MPSPLKLHLIILPLVLLSARCGLAEQEAIQAQNAPESEDSVNRTEQSGEIGQHNDALPRIFWINCINSVAGCDCRVPDSEDSVKVYHAEAAYAIGAANAGRQLIRVDERLCIYPVSKLVAKEYDPVLSSRWQAIDHGIRPFAELLPADIRNRFAPEELTPENWIANHSQKSLGNFWPTYYHLALEDFHPGDGTKVNILAANGSVLGRASARFLEQVMWEGSGISSTGLRLHYVGQRMRFETYSPEIWGYGAGHGYQVLPYRTIAVNFPGLCRALGLSNCSKSTVIGTLVYIPEVAARNIRMEGGHIHDGFFCANDTGSPNYIKQDRIDIFVGTHAGGNPYLPPARQPNLFINAGIRNLVPSDWRWWKAERERVWCDFNKIPADLNAPQSGDCTHDYHVVARHKVLSMFAFLDANGRPIRCAK